MTTDLPASAAPPATGRPSRRRPARSWARPAVEAVVVVAVFAAVGAGAGYLWLELWDPPLGTVQDGTWLYADFPAIESEFSATGLYVVIGGLGGLLLGILAAYRCHASELVTLVAVAAGSVLAAYVAYRVGLALAEPDPEVRALVVPDGTELPGRVDVAGRSPFVSWPVGALVGLAATYFLTGSVKAGLDATRPFDRPSPRPTTHDG